MKAFVHALATPALAAGFRLAGIATDDALSTDDAARRLEALAARNDLGVVLVEQALFDRLPDNLRRQLAKRALPIIVPIPQAVHEQAAAAEEYILELLRRAIGYRVRLQ